MSSSSTIRAFLIPITGEVTELFLQADEYKRYKQLKKIIGGDNINSESFSEYFRILYDDDIQNGDEKNINQNYDAKFVSAIQLYGPIVLLHTEDDGHSAVTIPESIKPADWYKCL